MSKSDDIKWEIAFTRLFNGTLFIFKYLGEGIQRAPYKNPFLYVGLFYTWLACYLLTIKRGAFWIFDLAYSQVSDIDSYGFFEGWDFTYPYIGLLVFSYVLMFVLVGLKATQKMRKLQEKLERMFPSGNTGFSPKVLKVDSIDNYSTKITLLSEGIGIDSYENNKVALESLFGSFIDKIQLGSDPQFVEITLTKKKIPKKCQFSDYESKKLKEASFIVGESKRGTIDRTIANLPHMLIAGTTGGGKSVFFKQALLGLLKSTPHLQMYLLDLKGGLEMKPFRDFPNVKVEKDSASSLRMLETVNLEMQRRFKYLEENNHKEIDCKRDNLDRLIVGVDEASMIYGVVPRGHDDHETVQKAREITDKIAKLGRAAGIHLILATQKITKETIGTSIQENVTGRVCFRMNSFQGSTVMLSNKSAMDLPEIPGRAIWQCGNQQSEFQSPYVDDSDIKYTAGLVSRDYEDGKKSNLQEILSIEVLGKGKEKENLSAAQQSKADADEKAKE